MKPLSAMGRSELLAELSDYRARDEKQTATYDAVVALIENPPAPTPALVRLMREAREQNPDGFKSHEELLVELNERRRQPVIKTCRDCAWGAIQNGMCHHAAAPQGDLGTDGHSDQSPPDWCPLRGSPCSTTR